MNSYRFGKSNALLFLRLPWRRNRKADQKHWGLMQRERGHSTIYSFLPTTVRGRCLIIKGEKQEMVWQNRFVKCTQSIAAAAAIKEARAFL